MRIKFLKAFSVLLLFVLFSQTPVFAFTLFKRNISSIIQKTDLDRTSVVSVSVKNTKNDKVMYKRGDKHFVNPASSLKLFTFAASVNTLGADYNFKTRILKDTKNNIYIKLGADPLLNYSDVKEISKIIKNQNFQKIYIDDTIIDKVPYPDGWLTDDLWPNMPKLSPYTLNKNMVSVKIKVDSEGRIEIYQPNPYKFSFINNLTVGDVDNIKILKKYGEENEIIDVEGTVSKETILTIPVNNPKFYFLANLKNALENEKIKYFDQFYFANTPNNVKEIGVISHNIKDVGSKILQDSDNFSSEIIFKVAGGKYKNSVYGSTDDGLEMFYDYFKNLGLNTSDIKVVDSSGVSRYNLLYADWMTNALIKLEDTNIKDYMATPGVGTLSKRLRHMTGSLWAKTGTLNNVSSIEGYITTKDKKNLVFVIIIQNFNKKSSVIKSIEDDLINSIYNM